MSLLRAQTHLQVMIRLLNADSWPSEVGGNVAGVDPGFGLEGPLWQGVQTLLVVLVTRQPICTNCAKKENLCSGSASRAKAWT